MSDQDEFQPAPGTIPIIPTAARIAYARTPADEDAIMLYFETAALGSFAFHIGPDAVPLLIAELKRVHDHLDEARRRYDES